MTSAYLTRRPRTEAEAKADVALTPLAKSERCHIQPDGTHRIEDALTGDVLWRAPVQ